MAPAYRHTESMVARRTLGFEAAIVDNDQHEIGSFTPEDGRRTWVRVAGPAALLVAKLIKIEERRDTQRLKPKNGLDVLRLLRAMDMRHVAERLQMLLSSNVAGETVRSALAAMRAHGARADGPIALLAGDAVRGIEDSESAMVSTAVLIEELLHTCDDL